MCGSGGYVRGSGYVCGSGYVRGSGYVCVVVVDMSGVVLDFCVG